MIPYVIQYATPSDDIRIENIETIYDSGEKEKMNEKIIEYIINIMYDWCGECNIKSYNDFCDMYWKIMQNEAAVIWGWANVFRVSYFENEWLEWNIEEHQEEIYIAYVIYLNKNGL